MGWWFILILTSIGIILINYFYSILDIHRPINYLILLLPILLINYGLWWIFENQKSFIITWLTMTGTISIIAICISLFIAHDEFTYKIFFGLIIILFGCFLINYK